MSIPAAIGYALGIIIFAFFFRRRRSKMIDKYIARAEKKPSKSDKGSQND
jgi:uncharacterized membrane protein YciS (DUF1049 family)